MKTRSQKILEISSHFLTLTNWATQATNSLKSCHMFALWTLGPLRPQILQNLVTFFSSDHLGHSDHKFSDILSHFLNLTTWATKATTSQKTCHTFSLWPPGPLWPQLLKKLVIHFHSDHLGHSGHKFSKNLSHFHSGHKGHCGHFFENLWPEWL